MVTSDTARRRLSAAELTTYDEQGFVTVPGVIDRAEVNRIDEEIDRLLGGGAGDGAPGGWIYALHQKESELCSQMARDERVLALVEQVVKPGVSLHSSKLVAKLPESDTVCHWHQDEAYYFDGSEPDMRSDVRMSIWIPLQDVTVANGCLWVVPGSHRSGIENYQDVGTGHCRRRMLRADYADEHAVPLPLSAGDMVLFSGFLWHHSKGNTTDRVRRAFIASYQEATLPRDAYGNPATILQAV